MTPSSDIGSDVEQDSVVSLDTDTSTEFAVTADWSRIRTRLEMSQSGDNDSDTEGTTDSEAVDDGTESFDMVSPGPSLDLRSVPTTTTRSTGSVMSLEDAQSSIDAFFTNRNKYTSNQANKLRFWQALCIEFGLVDMSSNPLPSFSNLGIIDEDSEVLLRSVASSNVSIGDSASDDTGSTSTGPSASIRSSKTSRKGNKSKPLPALPTSLTQARHLLATKAHVNLVDYMHARGLASSSSKKGNVEVPSKNFAYLVHPSRNALVRYTKETGKIFPGKKAKKEWLQPILKELF